MSDLNFPTLQWPNWKLQRTPEFVTRVQPSAAGSRCAAGFRSTPLWRWKLSNGILQADASIADLQAIEGFVNTLAGMYDSFLWTDPEPASFTGTNPTRVAFLSDEPTFERLARKIWQCGELSFQQVTA